MGLDGALGDEQAGADLLVGQANRELAGQCLLVVVILAAVPWPYVVRQYVIGRGERWR